MAKSKKSSVENEQLLQTVQMFEVIAETQPNDVQSLEILKEAYISLQREADAVGVSKKIAKAYVHAGQVSSAILEYEGVLQKFPDDEESLSALSELESKMSGRDGSGSGQEDKAAVAETLAAAEQFEDPNEALVRFFQEHELIKEKDAQNLLSGIHAAISQTPSDKPFPSLLSIMSERGMASPDKSLGLLAEKTRIPFIPLGIYDVDPAKSTSLEKDFCLKHLVLPFDQISRTTLVATLNPFDAQAKKRIEDDTQGRVQWYITQPEDMVKQLKSIFRIV